MIKIDPEIDKQVSVYLHIFSSFKAREEIIPSYRVLLLKFLSQIRVSS